MNQQLLEKYLWGAATYLRGHIDAGDYKQFIFPLLFFKRICDVYAEEFTTAMKESDGDQQYALFPEHQPHRRPPHDPDHGPAAGRERLRSHLRLRRPAPQLRPPAPRGANRRRGSADEGSGKSGSRPPPAAIRPTRRCRSRAPRRGPSPPRTTAMTSSAEVGTTTARGRARNAVSPSDS